MALVSVEEAITRVRAGALAPATQKTGLHKAVGRVLAAPIIATRDQPPFRASAMDGYAVRRASLETPARTSPESSPESPPESSPAALSETSLVTLAVMGESTAGRRYSGPVGLGQAVRIFTGAPLPDDCDAILIQENVRRHDDRIDILPDGLKTDKAHIRSQGQDFRAGDVLLEAATRLDPWRLSLAAAAGVDKVPARRRPRIAVLCTGDELVLPGTAPKADQIYESGSHAIMALIRSWGGKAAYLGVEGDSEKAVLKAVKGVKADMVVTIGGASVGDYDLVKPALSKLGLVLDFDGVKVRPGKPSSFGRLGNGTRVLGLPGNPASAFVVAQLLLKPWIEASLGLPDHDPVIQAVLVKGLPANGPRESYLRAMLTCSAKGEMQVEAFDDQDSSLIGVFARAGALIRRPAGAKASKAGQVVDILPLDRA